MKGNNWFKIKSFHSRDVFELVESIALTPLSIKSSLVKMPERDGSLNFTRINEYGRALYEDRIFTISAIARYDGTKAGRASKTSAVYEAIYNNQVGELTTSDTLNSKWDASLEGINSVDYIGSSSIRFVFQYRVSPFSHGTEETLVNKQISGSESLVLNCNGGAPCVKHKLTITNIADNTTGIEISNGKRTLYIDKALTKKTVVDFENFVIEEGGVPLRNIEWDGDFFELSSGVNNINITVNGSANFKWEYTPSYYFSIDIGGGSV